MLEGAAASTGRLSRPCRLGAFVVPVVPPTHSSYLSQQLKSRRRRTSGFTSDPLHAVPLPGVSSGTHEHGVAQRCRCRAGWAASRVGAGTSRNRGSLSSAAPQTLADPAITARCGAEETRDERGGGRNGGRFDAGGVGPEISSSSGSYSSGSSEYDEVRMVAAEAGNVSALGEELSYMRHEHDGHREDVLDGEVGGEGEEGGIELEAGIDESRWGFVVIGR